MTVAYIVSVTAPDRRILDAPQIERLLDLEGVESTVAISHDGNKLAVISSDDLWIVDQRNGTRTRITETPEKEYAPAWSADAYRLSFSRASDTFVWSEGGQTARFLENATWLAWSGNRKVAFVRDRALFLADIDGTNETKLVEAVPEHEITIRSPRFSPDSDEIAFIKTTLGLRGEIWLSNLNDQTSAALVADRNAENPMSLAWALDGTCLVYLTDRLGVPALWIVNFQQSTVLPLTPPLMTVPLTTSIGIDVWKDRIIIPRHFLDSSIGTSDGKTLIQSENLEFEPSLSPDGSKLVYTVARNGRFEIWMATSAGETPRFVTLGRQGRLSPNGLEVAYTNVDLNGNSDIWKMDIRTGSVVRVTDADEVDVTPDWSPDGQVIAFTSARGGPLSVWAVPSSAGKRLRINNKGLAPRISPDGRRIAYWADGAIWTMTGAGTEVQRFADAAEPASPVWTPAGLAFFRDGAIHAPGSSVYTPEVPIWPWFDRLPSGGLVVSPIDIRETALWSVDLVFKENP